MSIIKFIYKYFKYTIKIIYLKYNFNICLYCTILGIKVK